MTPPRDERTILLRASPRSLPIRLATLLTLALLPLAAHADTIDDLLITNGAHTIQFSLPASNTGPFGRTATNFFATATATIDGVPGYSLTGQYFYIPVGNNSLILFTPSAIFGVSQINFSNRSPGYLSSDIVSNTIVATFIPGTYTLQTLNLTPQDTYTLTITPETDAPVPEPSSLLLLATGTLGVLGATRRRFA